MDLQVKCKECGADLTFTPGTKNLSCTYCGHAMEVAGADAVDAANQELNLDDYINGFETTTEQVEKQVINCQGCGAETEFETNQQSSMCPFCDTPLVIQQAHSKNVINPKGILPFKINKKEATVNFKNWLSKLWFAPNDLKKQITQHDAFKGVYLPFWTYDCETYSHYDGERGEHYYVTVSDSDSDGKTIEKQEKRTRWSRISGRVYNTFDDIMVAATKTLPEAKLNALEPWDLHELVDYKDEYLSGYLTETYQVDLKTGYNSAKEIMDSRIQKAIKSDIGGDEQRVMSVDTHYQGATFKHILLPVWISAYHYRDKLYQILINARTGEVQGMRPVSWLKITLVVVSVLIVISVITYFFTAGSV